MDSGLSLDGYTLKGAKPYVSKTGSLHESSPYRAPHVRQGWIDALHWAEFCYIGRVDTLVADCVAMPHAGIQYIVLVRFEVEFTCVNGHLGAWRIAGDEIRTFRDMCAGSYPGAVSIAESLPQTR